MQFDNRRLHVGANISWRSKYGWKQRWICSPNIFRESPALYIHFGNRSLDLAWHDCVKESEIISDMLKVVQELAVFIRSSPPRMARNTSISPKKIMTTGIDRPFLCGQPVPLRLRTASQYTIMLVTHT